LSDRLHCAGSLQTLFDLLGKLGKGNAEVVRLLLSKLDKERFCKLLSVAAANLVDSNVFIHLLLLSLEHLSSVDDFHPFSLGGDSSAPEAAWASQQSSMPRLYLTHLWWDTESYSLNDSTSERSSVAESDCSESYQCDWFPTSSMLQNTTYKPNLLHINILSCLMDCLKAWVTLVGSSLRRVVLYPQILTYLIHLSV